VIAANGIAAHRAAKKLVGNNDVKPTVDIRTVKKAGWIIAIVKEPIAEGAPKKA
jgi:hypothetical protein